jgi:hypothetical protein
MPRYWQSDLIEEGASEVEKPLIEPQDYASVALHFRTLEQARAYEYWMNKPGGGWDAFCTWVNSLP